MRPARILLVEDNEMSRDMLSRRLERRGFEVVLAVDGEEALDRARTAEPDLVLMDLSLPKLNGWDAIRRLKSDPATRVTPIVALTAHAMPEDRLRAEDAGCDAFDTKPVKFKTLLAKIDALLATAKGPQRRARVLVVDDNEQNREMLARRLLRKGYDAVALDGGAAALHALATGGADVVLLDLHMPGMDGIEVLRCMRETRGKLDLPVVMVSAERDSALIVRAISAGANDYVTKPVDFPVALARIEALLSLRAEVEARAKPEVVIARSDSLERGFVLDGRYEIDDMVGEGGFAVVYRATQLSTGQTVAVKVMRADRLREEEASAELARFRREALVIQRISHPNIVRLIDSGTLRFHGAVVAVSGMSENLDVTRIAGTRTDRPAAKSTPEISVPFLVTEYLEGETLKHVLARAGALSIEATVDIMLPVLSGVGAAHRAGVVHRDLTPANIFLARSPDGALRPRVLDFGIAKATAVELASTTTSAIVGTPNYMSPEQARGGSGLTGASDQYTLAAVIYECITGKRPYEGESFISILQKVAKAEFVPPRRHDIGIPEELERVLVLAMAAKAEDRHASAEAFARGLLPFASAPTRSQWAPTFGVD